MPKKTSSESNPWEKTHLLVPSLPRPMRPQIPTLVYNRGESTSPALNRLEGGLAGASPLWQCRFLKGHEDNATHSTDSLFVKFIAYRLRSFSANSQEQLADYPTAECRSWRSGCSGGQNRNNHPFGAVTESFVEARFLYVSFVRLGFEDVWIDSTSGSLMFDRFRTQWLDDLQVVQRPRRCIRVQVDMC